MARDLGHAEDLVQHAYARVFASWPKLRTGYPEAYARRCIVNGHRDRRRRGTWKELPVEDCGNSGEYGDSDELSAERAERDAVLRALGRLTKRERAAVGVLGVSAACLAPTSSSSVPVVNAASPTGSQQPSALRGYRCLRSATRRLGSRRSDTGRRLFQADWSIRVVKVPTVCETPSGHYGEPEGRMSQLISWPDGDGQVVVEVDDFDGGDYVGVTRKADGAIGEAHQTFENALERVRGAAVTALRTFRDKAVGADEVVLEFGVKLTAEAGAVIAKTAAEAHLTVTLKWHKPEAAE